MTKVLSLRVADDLAEWATAYAETRGVTRQALLEEGLRSFKEDCERGVPEIRAERPAPRPIPTLRRASSIEARERANPNGLSRQARIEKGRGA